ncbi:MAG: 1-deoxy-D-xylulose-5-phosphate reductoisomerase [Candidatus Eisenbacteria bacterium]|nr:1-deoxy-D-xylulose-5-phosphate reductoisomerase [Candidatus Eisenbacteria bacterium]
MRTVAVLGATGSIGGQALEVAEAHRDRLRVTALSAGSRLDALEALVRRVAPEWTALERADDADAARRRLEDAARAAGVRQPRVLVGVGAGARLAAESGADIVVNGIVGAVGLEASLATLARGARLALANKESLVVGGPLVRAALARGGSLVPVDSEHSAAWLCLGGRPAAEVARLTLTASGGALRDHPDWRRATRDEVLAHPVWAMGQRITVDSALLFNKGLELIEARWLFDLDWPRLEAVVHREARVHAIAAFTDGTLIAQAARADMRLPIQLALSWPEHWPGLTPALDPRDLAGLSFEPIPAGRHPAFDLALAAGRAGGTAPCALNAADEVAVAAFLDGRATLGEVPQTIARVMDAHRPEPIESLAQLRAVDAWAREAARAAVARRA